VTQRSRRVRLAAWQLLAAVAGVAVAGGAIAVRAVQREIGVHALQSAQLSTELISELVVQRNVTGAELHAGRVQPGSRANIDRDVARLERRGTMVGFELWALDGGLLYADRNHPAEESRLPEAEAVRARAGAFIQPSPERRTEPTLDVVIPYDAEGDGVTDALIEVVLPRDRVSETITRWTRALYGGAGGVALLTAGALFMIRRRQRAQRRAARHDTLTGLGNRTLLAERSREVLAEPGRSSALLLLDLDDFKDVNDALGHHAGDELLVAVGHRLRSACRPADTVARLGGDEFAILLPDVPDAADALGSAERLLAALRQPVPVAGLGLEIGGSVGVAVAPDHGADLGTLLRRADVAMYAAKRDGAGVVAYQPGLETGRGEQLTLLAELRRAIGAAELRLHYQPKSTMDGRVVAVEALVRWQHPQRGLLGPGYFVPLAERTALIHPLTEWVLAEAARQAAAWRAEGQELTVAVNVTPRNLVYDDLPATVLAAADAAGLPASALEIEITETAAMTDPPRVAEIVGRLRRHGVDVWIDDFGAGYTSLSHLSTLPVSGLKIDRRFVSTLLHEPADEAVVRAVIHLARDLGLVSLAEGVETREVWDRLSDLGCRQIQGYVLSRPLPPDQLVTWIAAREPALVGRLRAAR
jgi:diguanylate cyclase (GGDEF)-like protein